MMRPGDIGPHADLHRRSRNHRRNHKRLISLNFFFGQALRPEAKLRTLPQTGGEEGLRSRSIELAQIRNRTTRPERRANGRDGSHLSRARQPLTILGLTPSPKSLGRLLARGRAQQLINRNIQHFRQTIDHVDCRIFDAALNSAHIGAVHSGIIREAFLRNPFRHANSAQIKAQIGSAIHASRGRIRRPSNHWLTPTYFA